MKKIISVLLAIVMMFSLVTVAFAAGEPSDPTPTSADTSEDASSEDASSEEASDEETTGGFNINDMPLWQLKLILKGGKVVIKLLKVVFKIAVAFGLIDVADVINAIIEYITNAQGGETEEPTTTEPVTEPSSEPVSA